MKIKKIIPLLLVLPLLASCGDDKKQEKGELVIPTVDVESLHIDLPEKPKYNEGEVKSDAEGNHYIDFYEVSDFHGAVNEETHSSGNYIGLKKLANYFNIKREENKGGTVLLSSGDMFQGSAESNLTRGYMVNYSMNYIGFESMTLGNHEFDWTDEWIKKNANLAYSDHKIPYLCANLIDTRTNSIPDFVSKSVTIIRGDYKIGIVGTIGKELKSSILASCVSNYDFTEEKSAVEAEAQALRNAGCDIVVWSSHNGLDAISPVNGVDAIFGGHAHINNVIDIGGVPAAATSNYGRGIAHIQLKIDKEKNVSCTQRVVDENPSALAGLTDNADVKKIMDGYAASIDNIKNIKLGKADSELKYDGALKNIAVEAMFTSAVKAVQDNNTGIPTDHIIASFHNVEGGIRSNIAAGEITYGNVYSPFPFDNEIVLYKVKGIALTTKLTSFAPYAVCRTFKNKSEIKPAEDYYLVLTDFIALSTAYVKGIFPSIEESSLIRTGKVVRDEVAKLIYAREDIKANDFSSGLDRYYPIPMV